MTAFAGVPCRWCGSPERAYQHHNDDPHSFKLRHTFEADDGSLEAVAVELVKTLAYIHFLCGEDYAHQPPGAIHHRVKVDFPSACEDALARARALGITPPAGEAEG